MGDPQLSWDLAKDVRQLFDFEFMVNAYRAGTIVAVMAGLIGWFMVLRRQTFAGHTLALVGFPGASGAALLGISELAHLSLQALEAVPGGAEVRARRIAFIALLSLLALLLGGVLLALVDVARTNGLAIEAVGAEIGRAHV